MISENLLDSYSTNVRNKAKKLAATPGAITRDTDHDDIWWIRSHPETEYRVQTIRTQPGHPIECVLCTCEHGTHAAAHSHCYHAAAVLMITREGKETLHAQTAPDSPPPPTGRASE